ncbi:MAG: DNA polymerase IV [Thermoanaerobaculaceae bacterium]
MTEPARVRRILHCDMDCYYAAVHMRDDPTLVGRPVVVGGDPQGRGVVASASYEARKFGIRSAMPAAHALRLCPQVVFLRPEFPLYRRESDRIFAIYREYTPLVETVSLDEAYLDVTDHLERHGTATAIAREIRQRVREERRLTVSVGVGPNMLVAKIASDFRKPDGLTVVPPDKVQAFLDPLPVRRLHGVGPATEAALGDLGISTVAELRTRPLEALLERFKSHGRMLHDFARGLDERPVETQHERKSLGTETTYPRDLQDLGQMDEELGRMAEEVADGLQRRELAACTVTVKVRLDDFTTLTRSRTVQIPTQRPTRIACLARDLLRLTPAGERRVRLLGVSSSTLVPATLLQLELFDEPAKTDRPAGSRPRCET